MKRGFYIWDGNSIVPEDVERVRIQDGVKIITERAFSHCKDLRDVLIPGSVEKIGYCAFSNCYFLKKIKLPKGVKEISEFAFYNCINLEAPIIPESVEKCDHAFIGCSRETKKAVEWNIRHKGQDYYMDRTCDNPVKRKGYIRPVEREVPMLDEGTEESGADPIEVSIGIA